MQNPWQPGKLAGSDQSFSESIQLASGIPVSSGLSASPDGYTASGNRPQGWTPPSCRPAFYHRGPCEEGQERSESMKREPAKREADEVQSAASFNPVLLFFATFANFAVKKLSASNLGQASPCDVGQWIN